MNKKVTKSKSERRKPLKLRTSEEEQKKLEQHLMDELRRVRIEANLRQDDLSAISGTTQAVISRMEKGWHSPQMRIFIRLLYVMGYTLKVVPIDKAKK